MHKPFTCLVCSSKDCEKTDNGTFEICQYGVSYVNKNGKIHAKEPKVPLSTIAKNLRHEINPILQLIIQEAVKIDGTLSTKKIELNKPLSVIVGSTVILDNFIQMITGVHEFHSVPNSSLSRSLNLKEIVDNCFVMYSVVKEEGRSKNLHLNNLISDDIQVKVCSDFIKYIISILIDNAWKYSIDDSTITVNTTKTENGLYNLKFTNISRVIPEQFDPFELGSKLDKNSKGFGYGLNWAKTLELNYNNVIQSEYNNVFNISHKQILAHTDDSSRNRAFQEFAMNNIILNKL